jgi:tRNA(adenine34) deaminase
MWDNLAPPWRTCLEEAWSAYCAGAIPIGAAITDSTGRVLARGRNRVYADATGNRRPHGHPLAHAETHAFEHLDWDGIDPHDCVLYSTMEPCPLCLGAFYMSGLHELHYAARDPYAGSINLLGATPYLGSKDVRAVGPASSRLEAISVALIVEFSLRRATSERVGAERSIWDTTAPAGVEIGKALHRSGELRRYRAAQRNVAGVVESLATLLDSLIANI